MSPVDSALLLRWTKERNAEAFKELTTRYATMVYATSTRILGNPTEAEDVTQECFERLAGMTEGPTGHLGAWLHRVATNRAIDRIRKRKRSQAREVQYVTERGVSTENAWNDIYEYVDEAMAQLPEKLREPMVAHYLEGQTHAQIAETLEITRAGVTRRIAKGVSAVRAALKRRGIPVVSASLAAMLGANLAEAAAIPASLESALGKLAVAGLKSSATATTVGTTTAAVGGLLVMKKAAIVAVVVAVATLGTWTATHLADRVQEPTASSSTQAKTHTQSSSVPSPPESDSAIALAGVASHLSSKDNEPVVESAGLVSEDGTIVGRIYDADSGEGLGGVYGYVHSADGHQIDGKYQKSDKSGLYRVSCLAPGTYSVSPQRPPGYPRGIRIGSVTVTVAAGQTLEGIDFALKKGIPVAGRVLSADGQPVGGARVGAMASISGMPEHATTQGDGTFVVRLAEPGGDLRLAARSDDFESKPVGPLVLTSKGLNGLVLTLTEAKKGAISGVVVDSRGRPVEGAHIHLDRGRVDYLIGSGSAKTEDAGSFRVERLASGDYGILLTDPGKRTFGNDDEVMRVKLAEGQEILGLRLVLGADKGGLAIAGRVIDTSGKPLKGVEVSKGNAKARSGEDGQFTITGLAEGLHFLNAHYMDSNANNFRYSPVHIPSVRAGTLDVEIVMHGMGTIEGRVLRADTGEPLSDFEVFVRGGAAEQFRGDLLVNGKKVREPEGRFSRDAYVGSMTITAKASGFAPAFQCVEVREREIAGGIELRLEPAAALRGTVVDSRGKPVSGARVFLGRVPHESRRDGFVAVTGADGLFTAESISPGIRELSAVHPAYASGTGSVTEHTTIVLEDAATLEGIVSRGGKPLEEVAVTVRYAGRRNLPWMGSRSGANGVYRVIGLPPGTATVSADIREEWRVSREVLAEAGAATKVNIDFSSGRSMIHGQVEAGKHDPQRVNVQCRVASVNGVESRLVHARPDGSYQIEDVPAGHVRLSAQIWSPGDLDMKQFVEFELAEEEAVQQDFAFSSEGMISGHFDGFNSSLYGAVIVLDGEIQIPEQPDREFFARMEEQHADLAVSQAECDASGAFAVENLKPGTYTLLALTVPKADDDNPEKFRCAASVVEVKDDVPIVTDFDFR